MSKYTAISLKDQGGSCGFYTLKESSTLGFKEFLSKKEANFAYTTQQKLAQFKFAPKVYGTIQRIPIEFESNGEKWQEISGWGFTTQMVRIKRKLSYKKIQDLVDQIRIKTGLLFWDCHEYNIGIDGSNKYLCIDTGRESFMSDCNAWGFNTPGPKCNYCNKYQCLC